ncbi:MAG: hypothetical protein HRT61_23355, partial [Ekhidna sp.]|nr:hypothetical protein [Ekhidna sp.]
FMGTTDAFSVKHEEQYLQGSFVDSLKGSSDSTGNSIQNEFSSSFRTLAISQAVFLGVAENHNHKHAFVSETARLHRSLQNFWSETEDASIADLDSYIEIVSSVTVVIAKLADLAFAVALIMIDFYLTVGQTILSAIIWGIRFLVSMIVCCPGSIGCCVRETLRVVAKLIMELVIGTILNVFTFLFGLGDVELPPNLFDGLACTNDEFSQNTPCSCSEADGGLFKNLAMCQEVSYPCRLRDGKYYQYEVRDGNNIDQGEPISVGNTQERGCPRSLGVLSYEESERFLFGQDDRCKQACFVGHGAIGAVGWKFRRCPDDEFAHYLGTCDMQSEFSGGGRRLDYSSFAKQNSHKHLQEYFKYYHTDTWDSPKTAKFKRSTTKKLSKSKRFGTGKYETSNWDIPDEPIPLSKDENDYAQTVYRDTFNKNMDDSISRTGHRCSQSYPEDANAATFDVMCVMHGVLSDQRNLDRIKLPPSMKLNMDTLSFDHIGDRGDRFPKAGAKGPKRSKEYVDASTTSKVMHHRAPIDASSMIEAATTFSRGANKIASMYQDGRLFRSLDAIHVLDKMHTDMVNAHTAYMLSHHGYRSKVGMVKGIIPGIAKNIVSRYERTLREAKAHRDLQGEDINQTVEQSEEA